MPIDIKLVDDGLGIIFVCRGTLTGQDFMEAKKALLVSDGTIERLKYGVIDGRAIESTHIETSDIKAIAEQDERIAAKAQPGAVVAIVAPRDLDYGIARMWQVFAERTGWTTMIFRSKPEAEVWIRRQVMENFGIDPTIE